VLATGPTTSTLRLFSGISHETPIAFQKNSWCAGAAACVESAACAGIVFTTAPIV